MVPNPIYIYHITHVNNLPKIIQAGGLKSKSQISNNEYTNIAHNTVQLKRSVTRVSCNPWGTVDQYVPFYFGVKSPMLYTVSQGNVDGYSEGQEPILYLITKVELIVESKLQFVFSDGHPAIAISEFYNNLGDLNFVNFDLMKEQWWNDTDEFPDRKRQRQAEFLVHQFCPWSQIIGIATMTQAVKEVVEKIMEDEKPQHAPLIKIKPYWYY